MDYFTADWHLNHINILRYCDRPFETVNAMNDEIIARINERVTNDDTLYVVGDAFMGSLQEAPGLLRRINGRKVLIKGNHDRSIAKMLDVGFDEAYKTMTYTFPDNRVAHLCHYPKPIDLLNDYDIQIHGHLHSGERVNGKRVNVAVDLWDFYPVCVSDIMKELDGKSNAIEETKCKIKFDGTFLTIDAKIRPENFSGVIDEIYQMIYGQSERE